MGYWEVYGYWYGMGKGMGMDVWDRGIDCLLLGYLTMLWTKEGKAIWIDGRTVGWKSTSTLVVAISSMYHDREDVMI